MVFTTICMKYNLDVKSTTHIPGIENIRCDELSRLHACGGSIDTAMANMGLGNVRLINLATASTYSNF